MNKRNPFKDALNGISAAYRSERNLRIHVAVAVVVIVFGFLLGLTRAEWCWVALCIALVITTELINTAIEAWVDLVSPDRQPLAGKAKDIAAGAVLIVATFAVLTGGIIFIPKLWMIITG